MRLGDIKVKHSNGTIGTLNVADWVNVIDQNGKLHGDSIFNLEIIEEETQNNFKGLEVITNKLMAINEMYIGDLRSQGLIVKNIKEEL